MKHPFIYAELEYFLKKMDTCHNNPEKSSTTKENKYKASVYSMFTHCSFDVTTELNPIKSIIKSEVIVIILENIEELLMIFVI